MTSSQDPSSHLQRRFFQTRSHSLVPSLQDRRPVPQGTAEALTSSALGKLETPRGSRPLSGGVSLPKWHWHSPADGHRLWASGWASLVSPCVSLCLRSGRNRRLPAFVSVRAGLGFGEPHTEHPYLKDRQRTYLKKEKNKADGPGPRGWPTCGPPETLVKKLLAPKS